MFPFDDVIMVKIGNRRLDSVNYRIALKFDRHLGSSAAEMPVKFQSDTMIQNSHPAASRLREIYDKSS